MTPRLYITLGKTGDILSLLPLLHLDAQSGNRSSLMVAKGYASILEGCSYLDPVIFNGEPHELERAHTEAVATGMEVVCCQVNGPPDQVAALSYKPRGLDHATTESFQKEAWKLAGRLGDWRNQPPLVFDRRSPEREAELLKFWPKNKKVILVSCAGSTSPFPYKDLLFELLRLKFGKGYQIVDLGKFQAERFYDLLALFERSHCLVTDDSAPLHLAYACPTLPVVALVNDRPLLWNGSCWRPNHIAHIRYRDFPKLAIGMLSHIAAIEGIGCRFRKHGQTPQIIHAWSAYESSPDTEDRRQHAAESWAAEYSLYGRWVCTPIEVGAIGQDSAHSELRDSKRFPYVHDVLRLACLRANDDDLICLTRCDTAFKPNITDDLLAAAPCFAHRWLTPPDTAHPATDLFCFTKRWWREHQGEYPASMVLGLDHHWHRILMELVKKHGGKELRDFIYRAHAKPTARFGAVPKYIALNERLSRAWLDQNSRACLVRPVHEQLPTIPLNRRALHSFGYNPSVIRYGQRLLMAYRYHDEGNASTALAMAELDDKFNVISNKPIEVPNDQYGSHEDARLFMFHGELHMSYVCSSYPAELRSVVRYGRLEDGASWRVVDAIQPDHGHNDGTSMEKNWLFFGHGKDLVYFYHSDEVVGPFPSSGGGEPLRWPWGVIRGGTTPLPYKGKLLTFFHSRLDNEPAPNYWRYAVGARLLSPEPPFATLAVSKEPILRGSEMDELTTTEKSSCSHHKPNVVFPCGAIEHEGGWLLSVGVNDCGCALVKVREEDLKL